MSWTIQFTSKANKDIQKIHVTDRRRIIEFLEERVAIHNDPRTLAKRLTLPDQEFWCFRVGDYRVIAQFIDGEMRILVITVAHRREVYR